MKTAAMAAIALAAAFAVGCDKNVTLVITNTLPTPAANVSVSVPGEGTVPVGTLLPSDQATRKVSIPKDMLPALCTARANGAVTQFSITDKTPGKLFLYIDPTGITTVRKGDEINKERHFEGTRRGPSGTVVTPDGPSTPGDGSVPPGRIIYQEPVVE
jgi:hypothetical protein